jgi:cobalt/nickel transport system permease protein
MHIPDGFLTGEAALAGTVAAGVGVGICLRGAARTSRERDLPLAGLAAALFLVGDAPMVPITVGTQGHLLGGVLAVALLGPWLGGLTITVVCLIQALALGDGGITTLGLTITNLALVPVFVGYPLLLALRRVLPTTARGISLACGATAFVCVLLAAAIFALEMTVGAAVSIDQTALAASILGTYAVIAVIEAVLTTLIVRGLIALRPDLVRVAAPLRQRRAQEAVARGRPSTAGAG